MELLSEEVATKASKNIALRRAIVRCPSALRQVAGEPSSSTTSLRSIATRCRPWAVRHLTEQRNNVIVLGSPGVGGTHLAVSCGGRSSPPRDGAGATPGTRADVWPLGRSSGLVIPGGSDYVEFDLQRRRVASVSFDQAPLVPGCRLRSWTAPHGDDDTSLRRSQGRPSTSARAARDSASRQSSRPAPKTLTVSEPIRFSNGCSDDVLRSPQARVQGATNSA